ncbi:carbohydrate binding domain-containing protein [Patescibacteria group bacterium]|nr:carbohydrate binding domain-containing protein [Patescibacteria group bacterium]MBU1721895.1 carbohydrate binding domain-containing protein [Patescibacteria group bacterium]MBU1900873.1 carbohydrate binding domain-containing protein [Patescibacteria group bacterium]
MPYRKIFLTLLLTLCIGVFVSVFPQSVSAQDTLGLNEVGQNVALSGTDIRIVIARIIQAGLGLLGTIALVLMVYAGFIWMTAGGQEDKIAQAKKIMINAVIGLVIILSALAIVQFVIRSLQDILIRDIGDGGNPDDGCVGIWCEIEPGDPVDQCLFENNLFVVKSITPNTDANDPTGMTNTVVRVLFSHGIAADTDLLSIVSIKSATGGAIIPKDVILSEDRMRVAYLFEEDTAVCQNNQHESCLPVDTYIVDVNELLEDNFGQVLQTDTVCGVFKAKSKFQNNKDQLDQVKPTIDAIEIDGKTEEVAGVNGIILQRGQNFSVQSVVKDRKNDQGGVSLVETHVFRDGGDDEVFRYNAPRVDIDAAKNAIDILYQFPLGVGIPVPARYTVVMTATDIDSNQEVKESHFVLVGETCSNGIQDGDETGVDIGGSCLGMGACTEDWECASNRCVDNQCIVWPMITGMTPNSWDGASGNLVTIEGKFFGEDVGRVFFDTVNDSGVVLQSYEAFLPEECLGNDLWRDNWIIVSVPAALPQGTPARIRVQKAMDLTFEDTSTDAHGPKPGPRLGIFVNNNVSRPGICVIKEIVDGNIGPVITAAAPEIAVAVQGKGFGTEGDRKIVFGTRDNGFSFWNNTMVQTEVPRIFGRVGVFVEVEGEVSNQYPLNIADPNAAEHTPFITDISPRETTKGSFVTVSGERFGEAVGVVYLATNPELGQTCTPQTCVLAEVEHAFCGDTWSNNHIIIKIPNTAEVEEGTYYPVVRNADGFLSNSTERLDIIAGGPQPGLCAILPQIGTAPLAEDADPLAIYGINISNDPTVYYWNTAAQASDDLNDIMSTWLSSANETRMNGDAILAGVVSNNDGDMLKTYLPFTDEGQTLMRGDNPIRVVVDGKLSNPVYYTVLDCRDGDGNPGENYHCCESGTEAGQWKEEGFICAGETRDAGYVWRFSSGIIPNFPRVLEECAQGEWHTEGAAMALPSPAPWAQRPQGQESCLNASILVKFSVGMDEETLTSDFVKMFTCDELYGSPDCTNKQEVNDTVISYIHPALYIWEPHDGILLNPNQWYRVELADSIQSLEQVQILGAIEEKSYPLQATRPCGDGTAYCFEFKTGNGACEIQHAAIEPPDHTASYLGRLQDPRYAFDSTHIFNPVYPLYYNVWGRGEKVCQPLSADGLGWEWRSNDLRAEVQLQAGNVGGRVYTDSRAVVDALEHTAPDVVEITANLSNEDALGPMQALSELVINIGDPKVIDNWPNCAESCTNAVIGLRFNRAMIPDTYDDGIHLYRCANEACQMEDINRVTDEIALDALQENYYIYRANPREVLEENTWYLVEATDAIDSIARFAEPLPLAGPALTPFSWKFRTKSVDGYCVLDSIRIDPVSFVANNIGEKTKYLSLPYSARNECSPIGQELNPWEYGWNWSVLDSSVATISDFASAVEEKPYCTSGCLLAGSDVSSADYTRLPSLCGDGVVGPGEDCDIALPQEVIGASCTLSCLRPGNEQVGNGAGSCGNGVVEASVGEECDNDSDFCSNTCLNTGSSRQEPQGEDVPWCGSREVTTGEDCDIALSYAGAPEDQKYLSSELCSAQCLHEGTSLSQVWCSIHQDDSDEIYRACSSALSVCGNGIFEVGESCEVIDGNLYLAGQNGRVTLPRNRNPERYCSNSCLAVNICELGLAVRSVDLGGLRCQPGTPGCYDATCQLIGSSVLYDESSFCGDSVVGIGEYAGCEVVTAQTRAQLGQNPIQVVTAVGKNIAAEDPVQETSVRARALRLELPDSTLVDIEEDVYGDGAYQLMCGYSEWISTAYTSNLVNDGDMERDDIDFWRGWGGNTDWRKTTDVFHNGNRSLLLGETINGGGLYQTDLAMEAGKTYQVSFWYRIDSGTLSHIIGVNNRANNDFEGAGSILGLTNGSWVYYERVFTLPENAGTPFLTRFSNSGGIAFIDDVRIVAYTDVPVSTVNDCPDNEGNTEGVGFNSCCYPRPTYSYTYPEDEAIGMCRNVAISVTFDERIDEDSVEGSVLLAQGYTDEEHICVTKDVTNDVHQFFVQAGEPVGFFKRIWQSIRDWFVGLFSDNVSAAAGDMAVWCLVPGVQTEVNYIEEVDTDEVQTQIHVQLTDILDPTETYAVVLQGGLSGIVNAEGVSIRGKNEIQGVFPSDDVFTFSTGEDICRIKEISVVPSTALFTTPSESQVFEALVESTSGQFIQPTDSYDWVWSWGPENNALFSIPLPPETDETAQITIASKDIEGELFAAAQVTIVADSSGDQEGNIISGTTQLIADFCERPWPERVLYPYTNDVYNFSMGYCTDDGLSGIETDDLPYLRAVVTADRNTSLYGDITNDGQITILDVQCYGWMIVGMEGCMQSTVNEADIDCNGVINSNDKSLLSQGGLSAIIDTNQNGIPDCKPEDTGSFNVAMGENLLYRTLFFNEQNEDVIGMQLFSNTERMSAMSWFLDQFTLPGSADDMQGISVAGYDAITDGNNYYINVLNESNGNVYNNIMLLSINAGAQDSTRTVFDQLLASLAFNTNLSDLGYCLASDVDENIPLINRRVPHDDRANIVADVDVSCSTDLDCRTSEGYPREGTNGVCSNVKTKFLRDWDRLNRAGTVVDKLEDYAGDSLYPALASGTYIPNYVNSRWPSWGNVFGAAIGTTQKDPIDQWSSCGRCTEIVEVPVEEFLGETGDLARQSECTQDNECQTGKCSKIGGDIGVCCGRNECGFMPEDDSCRPDGEIWDTAVRGLEYGSNKVCLDGEWRLDDNLDGVPNESLPQQVVASGQTVQVTSCTADSDCPGENNTCTQLDAQTCWDEGVAQFICPVSMSTFEYESQGDDYTLHVPFEYFDTSYNIVSEVFGINSDHVSDTRWCQPEQVHSPFGARCGDGIVSSGEQCDPPGKFIEWVVETDNGSCFDNNHAQKTCSDTCEFEYGSCEPEFDCGNGIIERYEVCDDGELNGTYGHCSDYLGGDDPNRVKACKGPHWQFCGNIEKDYLDRNKDGFINKASNSPDQPLALLELCDASVYSSQGSGSRIYEFNSYALEKEKSCSYTCQDYGEYCGDGEVQYDEGEACDDGNRESLDGCSNECQKENFACKAEATFSENPVGSTMVVINNEGDDYLFDTQIDSCYENTTAADVCRAYGLTCDYTTIFYGRDSAVDCETDLTEFLGLDFLENQVEHSLFVAVYCDGVYDGQQAPPTTPPGTCGDGVVQSPNVDNLREVCDLGEENGIVCDPAYGESCEYCSADCRVMTREQTAWCGNGIIDTDQVGVDENGDPAYEECDTQDGIVIKKYDAAETWLTESFQENGITVAEAICTDKGAYECSDDCKKVVNNCVECGVVTNDPESAVPKISVLNVLATKGGDGYTVVDTYTDNQTLDLGENIWIPNAEEQWGPTIRKELFDMDELGNPDLLGNSFWKDISDTVFPDYRYREGVNYKKYTDSQWLLADNNDYPFDAFFERERLDNGNWIEDSLQLGIKTYPLCKDEYAVVFNRESIINSLNIGDPWQESAVVDEDTYGYEIEKYTSFFPYPVTHQAGVINREFVLSPAVPEEVYRIVVRYDKSKIDEDIIVLANLYSEDGFQDDTTNYPLASSTFHTLNALQVMSATQDQPYICGDLQEKDEYWVPAASCAWLKLTNTRHLESDPQSDRVYMHAFGELEETVASAMTLGIGDMTSSDYHYAFFVSIISADGAELSIGNFIDLGISVDVYEYHKEQLGLLSLYTPDYSFTFDSASVDTSENLAAKYWHVFNVSKVGQNIRPIGTVETNLKQIFGNIPRHPIPIN